MDGLKGSAVGPDGTLYLSILISYHDDTYKLVAADPASGQILNQVTTLGGGQVAVAAGSVWVGEFTGGTDCSTTRLDPVTLAVQATIPTPCDFFGTTLASTGDAAWFIDRTLESYTKDGLRRIDPASNTPGDPVILPFFNGFLQGTATGMIYGDEGTDKGWYRLPVGQTQLQSLGARQAPVFPAGAGIWDQNDVVAEFFNGDGPAAQTIPIDGPLVGADDQAVYVEQTSNLDSSSELWRYPVDGSNPVLVATPPQPYGDKTFSYFDNDPLLVGPGGLVKLWVAIATDTSESALFAQWIPVSP